VNTPPILDKLLEVSSGMTESELTLIYYPWVLVTNFETTADRRGTLSYSSQSDY